MKKEDLLKEIINWAKTQDNPQDLYNFNAEVYDNLKTIWNYLERNQKQIFSVGDNVIIKARHGRKVKARVVRLLDKNIKVLAENNKGWTVTPSFLEHDLDPVTGEQLK